MGGGPKSMFCLTVTTVTSFGSSWILMSSKFLSVSLGSEGLVVSQLGSEVVVPVCG